MRCRVRLEEWYNYKYTSSSLKRMVFISKADRVIWRKSMSDIVLLAPKRTCLITCILPNISSQIELYDPELGSFILKLFGRI